MYSNTVRSRPIFSSRAKASPDSKRKATQIWLCDGDLAKVRHYFPMPCKQESCESGRATRRDAANPADLETCLFMEPVG